MTHISSRHPFTYSADLIRSTTGLETRENAARLRSVIAFKLGLDDTFLAGVLSEVYQVRNFKMILEPAGATPAGTVIPSHDAIVEAVLSVCPEKAHPDAMARVISSALDGRAETEQRLTINQVELLPDLVALAMAAYTILKTDRNAPEMSHPAIAAFYPLVEEVLESRAEAMRLEARVFFDFDMAG